MGKSNSITKKNIDAWDQPSLKSYHEFKYDEMIEDFHNDYKLPYDSVFQEKLADYEDTIKELISIEQGGNYFEPPPIIGRGDFYSDVKTLAATSVSISFGDSALSGKDWGFNLFAWIFYNQNDSPATEAPAFLFK